MDKNWLTLREDSFLWLKGNRGLVYNSKSKKQFTFILTDCIDKVCQKLLFIENLYTTELTDVELNDKDLIQWIDSLIKIQGGYLSYNVNYEKRPVSLKPILKVQNKKEYYEFKHIIGERGEILQNLHELTFYINGSEQGNNEYFRQYIYPLKECTIQDNTKILSFITNSRTPYLSNVNLVGNIFAYPDYKKLIFNITSFSVQCTIQILMPDLIDNLPQMKAFNVQDRVQFNVLVKNDFDVSIIKNIPKPFSITAFVTSEKEYMELSNIFRDVTAYKSIKFIPIYNKKNLNFFKSTVFDDQDDLDHISLSKNEIFIRQALNIGNFGRLTVMPDGSVYANVNAHQLGTINDSPYSLVYKEFIEGESWFKTREKLPCKECIYQWLCPSPSNYELILGKPNLCHVKPY